jgi:EmrB/QacA subfamily drug resistance transporter
VIFTASSLACGLAPSGGFLIGARVVQGLGGALMNPATLSIVTATFPRHERGKAIGIWAGISAMALAIGPLVGGLLTEHVNWQWIFFINVPIGVIAFALCPVLLRESRAETASRSYDPAGALTITGALGLLVYAVVEAPTKGWGSAQTIAMLAGSALLLVAFVVIESRQANPLVPLRFLRSQTLVGANSVMLFFGAVVYGMPFILTLYTQQVLGYSALRFGLTSIVFPIGAAIGSISGQAIVLRVGFRPVATLGMALMAIGALLLTQVSVNGTYFGDIFLGLLVFGPGVGFAFVTASIAALHGVPDHEAGLASGLSNTSFQIGAAIGVAIVSTVSVTRTKDFLAANAHAGKLDGLTHGFQAAFLASGILAALGAVAAVTLLGRRESSRTSELLEPVPAE